MEPTQEEGRKGRTEGVVYAQMLKVTGGKEETNGTLNKVRIPSHCMLKKTKSFREDTHSLLGQKRGEGDTW